MLPWGEPQKKEELLQQLRQAQDGTDAAFDAASPPANIEEKMKHIGLKDDIELERFIENATVVELKKRLRHRGLRVSGRKAELQDRLREHISNVESEDHRKTSTEPMLKATIDLIMSTHRVWLGTE